ncbi:MAG: site-2 protease family protein [Lachnospiraceae bacterium]|nr:site-2 protease family protein [Lachnospiraceae bacterium]
MSIVIAILVLGLIITVHELGHFFMAKLFKVPVREFSIGMGPRLVSKVINNTRYSLKVLPFGGSCAMIGEDAAGSGDMIEYDDIKIDENGLYDFEGVKYSKEDLDKYNFQAISPVKKFLICLAGPSMNFLLAFLLAFVLVSRIGFDVPVISNVSEGSAAANAKPMSLEKGDEIVGLELPDEKESIICYRDLAVFMQLNNDDILKNNYPLAVTFKRESDTLKTVVYPTFDETYNKAMIGISFENMYQMPKNFFDTCKFAAKEFYFYIKTTIMSLRMLIRGKLGANQISGPVGTVAVMGSAINEASAVSLSSMIYTLLTLIVLISANLGVMNLLPIPALDGGRIVFAAIEMIIGKPLNKDVEGFANTITMLLLLIFMIWIFGMDIYKLLSGSLLG